MIRVIYLRGLNTYGDDFFRIGPLKFGWTHKHLVKEFSRYDIELIPVLKMGIGSPWELAERARKSLKNLGNVLSNALGSTKLHILGHSMGGLTARALLQHNDIACHIRSLTTIGTPHFGCHFADVAHQFCEEHPITAFGLKIFGYDVAERQDQFDHLSSETMNGFNQRCLDHQKIQYAHVLCFAQGRILGPQFKLGYRKTHARESQEVSDGLVGVESQKWGVEIGRFELDHAAQLGFCFHLNPKVRQEVLENFNKMVEALAKYWWMLSAEST